jgi:hypothetical protein
MSKDWDKLIPLWLKQMDPGHPCHRVHIPPDESVSSHNFRRLQSPDEPDIVININIIKDR